jgi:hypothetical protein
LPVAKTCEECADAGVTAEAVAITPSAIAKKIEVRNMAISCGWYEMVEHPALTGCLDGMRTFTPARLYFRTTREFRRFQSVCCRLHRVHSPFTGQTWISRRQHRYVGDLGHQD